VAIENALLLLFTYSIVDRVQDSTVLDCSVVLCIITRCIHFVFNLAISEQWVYQTRIQWVQAIDDVAGKQTHLQQSSRQSQSMVDGDSNSVNGTVPRLGQTVGRRSII
jgi:hypothetical protein